MAIDGQYKQELIEALRLLLREGLEVKVHMYSEHDGQGAMTSATTRIEVVFYGETVSDTEATTTFYR